MAMEILEARWTSWTLKRLGGLSFLEPFNRAVLAVNQVGIYGTNKIMKTTVGSTIASRFNHRIRGSGPTKI
jgi:hypothetical protein